MTETWENWIRLYATDKGVVITDGKNVCLEPSPIEGLGLHEGKLEGDSLVLAEAVLLRAPSFWRGDYSRKFYAPETKVLVRFYDSGKSTLETMPRIVKAARTISGEEYRTIVEQFDRQKADYSARVDAICAQTKEAKRPFEEQIRQLEEKERENIAAIPKPSLAEVVMSVRFKSGRK